MWLHVGKYPVNRVLMNPMPIHRSAALPSTTPRCSSKAISIDQLHARRRARICEELSTALTRSGQPTTPAAMEHGVPQYNTHTHVCFHPLIQGGAPLRCSSLASPSI